MNSPLEQRLQFAYGLLYDAARWIERIGGDAPALSLQVDSALDHVEQAQGAIEEAKMAITTAGPREDGGPKT